MGLTFSPKSSLKILDWDIEARPLAYLGGDFTTGEPTAIAASFVGEKKVHSWYLTAGDMRTDGTFRTAVTDMLLGFVELYNQADIVTGHYIVMFDLPKINGALVENGLPQLKPKMVSDTKVHLSRFSGISKSQENLGEMLALHDTNKSYKYLSSKEHMNNALWRQANRLTCEGVAETKRRVEGDVKQHKELRLALIAAGVLNGPKVWRP